MNVAMQKINLAVGATEIEVWTIGARLNAVSWGGFDGLVDGSESINEALGPKLNHGCVVGPVANRIAGSRFKLDGKTYSFPPNEGGATLCHSGNASLRDRTWTVTELGDHSVVLTAEVGDMEDGFPGNRVFEADYRVSDYGFDLRLSAETDAPTLVNLALHPYWTLDGRGREGQSLFVDAGSYLPVDALKIPTGEISPVAGTIFDLRTRAVPSTEIDHNYCLSPQRPVDAPAARLVADRGVALDILTDAPGLQVFTGKPVGIALEPQHWPDAPHHPAFPSIRLEPGVRYEQTTLYRFSRV